MENDTPRRMPNVPPFVKFVCANVPMVFDDSLSYYEALCALWKYVQGMTDVINNNATLEEEYIEKFNELSGKFDELKTYVETYFDNLDVQEEINNKLDAMAEDGTLKEIMQPYFDNLAYTYTINEITIEQGKHTEDGKSTDYWITHIPHLDSEGNIIPIKHGTADDAMLAADITSSETALSFAHRKNATLCVNASIYDANTASPYFKKPVGPIIVDGTLVSNFPIPDTSTRTYILGIKEDNSMEVFAPETTPLELEQAGVVNTIVAFDQVIEDGVITGTYTQTPYSWQLLGQNTDTLDIYIFTCNGGNIGSQPGIKLADACQYLLDKGCDFAYRLDQGGSTTTVYNGTMLNMMIDDYGRTVRKVPDFLYFAKPLVNNADIAESEIRSNAGDTKSLVDSLRNKIRYPNEMISSRLDFYYPNLRQSSGNGALTFAYSKNNVADGAMVFSPDNRPKSLNLYDATTDTTVATIDGLNEKISFMGKDVATIYAKTVKEAANYNIDNIFVTSIKFIPPNATVNPPFNTRPYLLITLADDSGTTQAYQIALALTGYFGSDATYNPQIRYRNAGTWGAWKAVTIS